jgi:CPA2 family monovalent cation:H+ antiporter-2
VILEMNPERVRSLRRDGEPARYGDAIYEPALRAISIHEARVLVVTISDPAANRRIISLVRALHPGIHIVVRTRYVAELGSLQALGANQVVAEEFETSIEIFTRVLAAYLIPHEDIQGVAAEIRAEGYQMLRMQGSWSDFTSTATLPGTEVRAYRVAPGSEAADHTLGELDLRRRYQVTVLAVRRGEETLTSPGGEERLQAEDVVVLLGKVEDHARSAAIFGLLESGSALPG